jgi:hypothetical protein
MRSRDDGAALLFVAMTLLLLLGVAALVIDLGSLRYDLRADRLASDLAATAGASALDPFDASSGPQEACEVAKAYALLNLGETTWAAEPDCSPMPTFCDASTQPPDPPVSGDVGPYHIEIVYPVPDDDPLMAERPIDLTVDGAPCQRIGVSITRTRDYTFARVLGLAQGATDVASVARYGAGPGLGEVVPLVILEPHDCSALYTSGQGKVTVTYFEDTPGLIVVDSDATTCSQSSPYVIDAKGVQKGWIRALPVPGQDDPYVPEIPSAILSYALFQPSPSPSHAYDPSDLTSAINPADLTDPTEPAKTWFRLYPRPTGISARVTRAPIDYRYNCKTNYPTYLGVTIPDCTDEESDDYIDQLVGAYGSGSPSGASLGTGGFTQWTTYMGDPNYPTGLPCNFQGSDPSPVIPNGNWYVDCPGTTGNSGFTVDNTVIFGPGDVVFSGQVRSLSGGDLQINEAAGGNHVVYVRQGDLIKDAQSSISLEYTMVYLADGRVDFNGGDGGLLWTAPDLAPDTPPSVFEDHFEDLALWSESPELHHIGGQAGNVLEGTFFTPYADPFELGGQGSQFQTEAQFVTRKLELSGLAEVRMEPNPDRFTPIPIRDIRLIR